MTKEGKQRVLILSVVAAIAAVVIIIVYSATRTEVQISVEKADPFWVVTNTGPYDLSISEVSFNGLWSAPLARTRPTTRPTEKLPGSVVLHQNESCVVLNATRDSVYQQPVQYIDFDTNRGKFRYMVDRQKFE
jgi:hypothetical protein